MAGLVTLSGFIGESPLRVPAHEARVIIRQLLAARIAQIFPVLVRPGYLVRVGRVRHRLLRFVHPLRNRAEIDDHRMPGLGIHEIFHHRVDQGEFPRSVVASWRLEFRHCQLGVGKPGHITNVVSSQIAQSLENPIVDF